MNVKRLILLLIVSSAVFAAEKFQPERFELSDFSFTRPKAWEWVNTVSNPPTVGLKIVDPKTKKSANVAMMHYNPKNPMGTREAALKRWCEMFTDSTSSTNDVMIGKHKVSYLALKGTHKGYKVTDQPRPDYGLLGAVIEDEKGSIVIKMLGPEVVVQKAKPDLKRLVEQAVKERENGSVESDSKPEADEVIRN